MTSLTIRSDDGLDKLTIGIPVPVGFGDVLGPSSSTDEAIARFDGTNGKALQNSIPTIDDTGQLDMQSQKILQLAAPTVSTDAANKDYVDTQIGAAWIEDEFTPTAAQVSFTLSAAPGDLDSFSLFVNGVRADDTADFTVSGTTLTWLNTLFTLGTADKLHARYV